MDQQPTEDRRDALQSPDAEQRQQVLARLVPENRSVQVGRASCQTSGTAPSGAKAAASFAFHAAIAVAISPVSKIALCSSVICASDSAYVVKRLKSLGLKRAGRNLKAGQAQRWNRDAFESLGLHRLRGCWFCD